MNLLYLIHFASALKTITLVYHRLRWIMLTHIQRSSQPSRRPSDQATKRAGEQSNAPQPACQQMHESTRVLRCKCRVLLINYIKTQQGFHTLSSPLRCCYYRSQGIIWNLEISITSHIYVQLRHDLYFAVCCLLFASYFLLPSYQFTVIQPVKQFTLLHHWW